MKNIKEWPIQGVNKLLNYFYDFFDNKDFQQKVMELRNKYKIPLNGFPINKNIGKDFQISSLFYRPKENDFLKDKNNFKNFNLELKNILSKFELNNLTFKSAFRFYIFHNELPDKSNLNFLVFKNVCNLIDVKEQLAEFEGADPYQILDILGNEASKYPISIKLSPYATNRDILDYVKKMYPIIKNLQNKYKIPESKVGRIKKKDPYIKKRNDLIYRNMGKPRKLIRSMIKGSFEEIDETYISKIISNEKKRRK